MYMYISSHLLYLLAPMLCLLTVLLCRRGTLQIMQNKSEIARDKLNLRDGTQPMLAGGACGHKSSTCCRISRNAKEA